MMARSPEPEGGTPHRTEYHVPSGASFGSLLNRVRQTPDHELLLDITDHEPLRTDGALRRTLAAAAGEVGKRVTFSVLESAARSVNPGSLSPSSLVQTPRSKNASSLPDARTPPRSSVRKDAVPASVVRGSLSDDLSEQHGISVGFSFPRLSAAGKRIAFTFAFFAGVLATSALVFLAPHAEVVVTPHVEPIHTGLVVRAGTDIPQADPANGILPARVLSLDETVERAFPVEHTVERGERAQGTIRLVNRTDTEQRIKGGSRLQAENGAVVRMKESAVVPPRSTVEVAVVADEGGTKGNLQEGELAFVALSRDARQVLFGRVEKPLVGGTDRPVPVLAEEDIRRAAEQLTKDAHERVRQKMLEQLPAAVLRTEELIRVRVTDAKAREALGSEISEFHLLGRIRGEYFIVGETDLLGLFRAMALSRTEGKKTLGKPLAAEGVRVEKMRWEEGFVDLALRVENIVHEDLDIALLKERLAGRTSDGAAEYLRALPGVKDVHVTLSPFWIRRVPSIPRNVNVVLELPE